MAILEARRKALAAEGLFDDGRKTRLPFLPTTIGVVTSPTGSVIRDILHRIGDRFPRNVLVWPVRVQGETAAAEVAAAIAGFDALQPGGPIPRPDVLIVARGGGSLEDLWAFNEEVVIRTAAACSIPLISAVGHETDWTLIDHVADLRAPTPSGAAEKAVPVRTELLVQHNDRSRHHDAAILRVVDRRRSDLRGLSRALPSAESVCLIPRQRLDRAETRLAATAATARDRRHLDLARLAHRLSNQAPRARLAHRTHQLAALEQRIRFCLQRDRDRRGRQLLHQGSRIATVASTLHRDGRRARERLSRVAATLARSWSSDLRTRWSHIERLERLLDTLGYRQVLSRGFALVRDSAGHPVRSIGDVAPAATLDIEFADGHIETIVGGRRRARPPKQGQTAKAAQGSLF